MEPVTRRVVTSGDGSTTVAIDAPAGWVSSGVSSQLLVLVHTTATATGAAFADNTMVNPDASGELAVGSVVARNGDDRRLTEFVVLPTSDGVLGQLRTLLNDEGRCVEVLTSMLSEQWSEAAAEVEAMHASVTVSVERP